MTSLAGIGVTGTPDELTPATMVGYRCPTVGCPFRQLCMQIFTLLSWAELPWASDGTALCPCCLTPFRKAYEPIWED